MIGRGVCGRLRVIRLCVFCQSMLVLVLDGRRSRVGARLLVEVCIVVRHMPVRGRLSGVLCGEAVGLLLGAIWAGAVAGRGGVVRSAISAGRGGHRTRRVGIVVDSLTGGRLEGVASILVPRRRIQAEALADVGVSERGRYGLRGAIRRLTRCVRSLSLGRWVRHCIFALTFPSFFQRLVLLWYG